MRSSYSDCVLAEEVQLLSCLDLVQHVDRVLDVLDCRVELCAVNVQAFKGRAAHLVAFETPLYRVRDTTLSCAIGCGVRSACAGCRGPQICAGS